MKSVDRSKQKPEIGQRGERLVEDRKFKPKTREQAGTRICERCGAIGMHKHWFADRKLGEHYAAEPQAYFVICPGCKRIEDKVYEGEVVLDSPLIPLNKEMVYGTIYHTAAKAFHDNPLARVATIEEQGNRIRILTTTKSLAERLGKSFKRAFKGHLEIKPSYGEQFAIVNWSRPELP